MNIGERERIRKGKKVTEEKEGEAEEEISYKVKHVGKRGRKICEWKVNVKDQGGNKKRRETYYRKKGKQRGRRSVAK